MQQKIIKHVSDMDRRACAHLSDVKIDWFRLIVDLGNNGYGLKIVALSVGVGYSTLIGWKQGSRPKYEEGEILIDLWVRVTGNCRETVPRISRYSHRA